MAGGGVGWPSTKELIAHASASCRRCAEAAWAFVSEGRRAGLYACGAGRVTLAVCVCAWTAGLSVPGRQRLPGRQMRPRLCLNFICEIFAMSLVAQVVAAAVCACCVDSRIFLLETGAVPDAPGENIWHQQKSTLWCWHRPCQPGVLQRPPGRRAGTGVCAAQCRHCQSVYGVRRRVSAVPGVWGAAALVLHPVRADHCPRCTGLGALVLKLKTPVPAPSPACWSAW